MEKMVREKFGYRVGGVGEVGGGGGKNLKLTGAAGGGEEEIMMIIYTRHRICIFRIHFPRIKISLVILKSFQDT